MWGQVFQVFNKKKKTILIMFVKPGFLRKSVFLNQARFAV